MLPVVSSWRQRLVRRRVRAGIVSAVGDALPLLRRFAGETRLRRWVDAWLDKAPPQTRFYWRLPVEFAVWLSACHSEPVSSGTKDRVKNPPKAVGTACLSELAHFEAMQLEVLNAPDPDSPSPREHSGSDDILRAHPSARLGIYHYPVFRIDKKMKSLPARGMEPSFVLLYRANEACRWLLLPPRVAQLLAQAAQNRGSLHEALAFLRRLYGHVDERFIRGELIDLQRLGVLLSPD